MLPNETRLTLSRRGALAALAGWCPLCVPGVALASRFKAPIEASTAQIQQFAQLFPSNARPAMPRHRRFLLESL